MLVLLGVPWIFSAFGVVDPAGNKSLETMQTVFNVSDLNSLYRPRSGRVRKTEKGELK